MCGLPLGHGGLRPLGGFLSEAERPHKAPGGPSNWLWLPGKIDGKGYKWPPSNCLTETQHIRPTGLHNLGLIYLPRDVCNPIPLHLHLDVHPLQSQTPPSTPLKLNIRHGA